MILTRDKDQFLTLEERTARANTENADLFVSIHVNAHRNKNAYGTETYLLNLATDEESIRVAAMENATSTKNISDLQTILMELMQNAKINESSRLAGYVQSHMVGHLSKKYSKVKDKGVKQAPFYVLLGAQMPAILVETAFISNPSEEKRLKDPAWQRKIARTIADGVQDYFYLSPPPGTWLASNRKPVKYRVVRGDTLGEIANRYRVSLYSLRRANNLRSDTIRVGAELLIPTT